MYRADPRAEMELQDHPAATRYVPPLQHFSERYLLGRAPSSASQMESFPGEE